MCRCRTKCHNCQLNEQIGELVEGIIGRQSALREAWLDRNGDVMKELVDQDRTAYAQIDELRAQARPCQ